MVLTTCIVPLFLHFLKNLDSEINIYKSAADGTTKSSFFAQFGVNCIKFMEYSIIFMEKDSGNNFRAVDRLKCICE